MPQYNADARLAAPIRLHTLTPSAEAARVAMREHRTRAAAEAPLVTQHPHPHAETVPASARALEAAAVAAGFEVRVVFGYWTLNAGKSNERQAEACQVAGLRAGVAFQAVWSEGAAKAGIWRAPHAEFVGVAEVKARVKAMGAEP